MRRFYFSLALARARGRGRETGRRIAPLDRAADGAVVEAVQYRCSMLVYLLGSTTAGQAQLSGAATTRGCEYERCHLLPRIPIAAHTFAFSGASLMLD